MQINVYDTELAQVSTIDLPKVFEYWNNKTKNICGIDGVAIGKDPEGNVKMMIGCGIEDKSTHSSNQMSAVTKQVILQYSLDGKYEKEYDIETGYRQYGIQSLSYDNEKGEYWLATYGPEAALTTTTQTLFCVNSDLKTINGKWDTYSPYGVAYLGQGKFLTSGNTGNPGNNTGYAYLTKYDKYQGLKRTSGLKNEVTASAFYDMDTDSLRVTGGGVTGTSVLSGTGMDGTTPKMGLSGGTTNTTDRNSVADSALHFDGTAKAALSATYVTAINDNVSGGFTLSAWVNRT
ncbi:MAG: hypothetical protein RR444_09585 [Oscillospiraceae bacterium]